MPADPQVVAELRSLFKDGATPSRLIRHIVDRHPGEERLHFLVQDYFREAFAVGLVRISKRALDEPDSADLPLAFLNIHLTHEMVGTRPKWDRDDSSPANGRPSWLAPLSATDEAALIEQTQPVTLPELAGCWDRLDPIAQAYVRRVLGNADALYERVQILARLAERLQQKVLELEDQVTNRQGDIR